MWQRTIEIFIREKADLVIAFYPRKGRSSNRFFLVVGVVVVGMTSRKLAHFGTYEGLLAYHSKRN